MCSSRRKSYRHEARAPNTVDIAACTDLVRHGMVHSSAPIWTRISIVLLTGMLDTRKGSWRFHRSVSWCNCHLFVLLVIAMRNAALAAPFPSRLALQGPNKPTTPPFHRCGCWCSNLTERRRACLSQTLLLSPSR
ncbi:hypothetical protein BT67DRAFT_21763 [Trichocladium antarcticum]|uniref:Uncharacterized protein n=1 Tax=Trichocladium antarcticum TaxID=1450529 RepID=A0AAN6UTZ8_9PEZI|nr:hypothetical protein BT67DRAFT_21763 [Trichocladium antarcticum]